MSDHPPPDWYTDPEDDSQYRYWDGSAWTGHRAPRHADAGEDQGPAPGRVRGPGQLVSDTFSLVGRQWRGCAAAALIHIVGEIVGAVLVIIAANDILMGELGEVWRRVSDPSFDATTPENEAYFESLEVDLSLLNLAPIVLGLLAFWVASNVMSVAVARITLGDLRGRVLTTSDALRHLRRRVLRLMGLDLQLLAIFLVAVLVTVLAAVVSPLLLIPLIPAFIAGAVYAAVVVSLAYVVASVGPATPSLLYGARLVRGRFWGTLGRMLLVFVVLSAISLAVGLVLALAGTSTGPALELTSQLVQTVVGAAVAVVGLVAVAILYVDLGGESD